MRAIDRMRPFRVRRKDMRLSRRNDLQERGQRGFVAPIPVAIISRNDYGFIAVSHDSIT